MNATDEQPKRNKPNKHATSKPKDLQTPTKLIYSISHLRRSLLEGFFFSPYPLPLSFFACPQSHLCNRKLKIKKRSCLLDWGRGVKKMGHNKGQER